MDDFIPTNLKETTNEWTQKLLSILTPLIYEGIQSIFNEAYSMCLLNKEYNKYLMTFQNCIRRIPKYNQSILEIERKRIIEKSGCNYLEDLITCVHISILKSLTCIRVGNRQKKIDISIPKLDVFIHNVYINVGRKIYTNTDLYMLDVSPQRKQRNRREIEYIIQKAILTTIRDSIPYEQILASYLDETEEHEEEEFEKENEDDEIPPPPSELPKEEEFKGPTITDMNEGTPLVTKVSFNPTNINNTTTPDLEDDPPITTSTTIHPTPPRKLLEEDLTIRDNSVNDFELDIFDLNDSQLPDANPTTRKQSTPLLGSGFNNEPLDEDNSGGFNFLDNIIEL